MSMCSDSVVACSLQCAALVHIGLAEHTLAVLLELDGTVPLSVEVFHPRKLVLRLRRRAARNDSVFVEVGWNCSEVGHLHPSPVQRGSLLISDAGLAPGLHLDPGIGRCRPWIVI